MDPLPSEDCPWNGRCWDAAFHNGISSLLPGSKALSPRWDIQGLPWTRAICFSSLISYCFTVSSHTYVLAIPQQSRYIFLFLIVCLSYKRKTQYSHKFGTTQKSTKEKSPLIGHSDKTPENISLCFLPGFCLPWIYIFFVSCFYIVCLSSFFLKEALHKHCPCS